MWEMYQFLLLIRVACFALWIMITPRRLRRAPPPAPRPCAAAPAAAATPLAPLRHHIEYPHPPGGITADQQTPIAGQCQAKDGSVAPEEHPRLAAFPVPGADSTIPRSTHDPAPIGADR